MARRKSITDIAGQAARLYRNLGGLNFFARGEERNNLTPRQRRVLEIRDRYVGNIERNRDSRIDVGGTTYRNIGRQFPRSVYMGLNNG